MRLPDAPQNDGTSVLMAQLLNDARDVVDKALGFGFFRESATWDAVVPVATPRTVRAERSTWLRLPPYLRGSIAQITLAGDSAAITAWDEAWEAGLFLLERADGWQAGRYTVTARFGYGPPPESIVALTIELAVNAYRTRDKGLYTEIIGVEGGGGVRYLGGLNQQQRMVLANVRRQYVDALR
jgi:hypothetical protein